MATKQFEVTPRQQEYLNFIKDYYIRTHGAYPSIRNIADGFGMKSVAPVQAAIYQLIDKGALIRHESGKARSMKLIDPPALALDVRSGDPKEPLTDCQAAYLDCIKDLVVETGLPPTLREIAEAMSLRSQAPVQRIIRILVEKGYLREIKEPNGRTISRGIQVVE